MATFLSLITFTQQGAEAIEHTLDRAAAFEKSVAQHGGKVRELFWTLGGYDGAIVFDAPDAETAVAIELSLVRKGNVRTQTMAAFDRVQMQAILGKVS
ncbi:MAG: GYD family protein [Planctomycetota bacterium]|nr:MAG: GYD family protein [Planctomycetota bacterium]